MMVKRIAAFAVFVLLLGLLVSVKVSAHNNQEKADKANAALNERLDKALASLGKTVILLVEAQSERKMTASQITALREQLVALEDQVFALNGNKPVTVRTSDGQTFTIRPVGPSQPSTPVSPRPTSKPSPKPPTASPVPSPKPSPTKTPLVCVMTPILDVCPKF